MRRKKGDPFSGRPHSGLGRSGRFLRWLVLAALILLVLACCYGCAVQKLVYSSRGTMIFLPSGF